MVLVAMAMRLFTREWFRQKSGHMDKPVLNLRANLHKYKMKLLPVWGPRLCAESRSVLHFLGGGNHQHVGHATTSSFSLVWKARCQVVSQSSHVVAVMMFPSRDVREAFEQCAAHEASRPQ